MWTPWTWIRARLYSGIDALASSGLCKAGQEQETLRGKSMSKAGAVLEEVKKAVVGKDEVLVQGLLAILAGGHILLEDIPGVGKTAMALAFSRALALEYNRVQFTPDVLPRTSRAFP